MALGLGTNFTVLSALQTRHQIASRVWSMFYGLTGVDADAQLDGVLVLGGYDHAKMMLLGGEDVNSSLPGREGS